MDPSFLWNPTLWIHTAPFDLLSPIPSATMSCVSLTLVVLWEGSNNVSSLVRLFLFNSFYSSSSIICSFCVCRICMLNSETTQPFPLGLPCVACFILRNVAIQYSFAADQFGGCYIKTHTQWSVLLVLFGCCSCTKIAELRTFISNILFVSRFISDFSTVSPRQIILILFTTTIQL